MEDSFLYQDKKIPIRVVRSRRKSISLSVDAKAEITIRVPLRFPLSSIRGIVEEKEDWLSEKLAYWEQCKTRKQQFEEQHGRSLLYQGDLYPLIICEDKTLNRASVGIVQSQIIVSVPKQTIDLAAVLQKWYSERTLMMLTESINKFRATFPVEPQAIKVKEQKKRWGSCSYDNRLLFNWRLSMAPQFVVDYVAVHEMSHMLVKNHSPLFWAEVLKRLPAYQNAKKWLKENGINMEIGADLN